MSTSILNIVYHTIDETVDLSFQIVLLVLICILINYGMLNIKDVLIYVCRSEMLSAFVVFI